MKELSKNDKIEKIVDYLNQRTDVYIIGISGYPGSGKTTISKLLEKHLPSAIHLPLDGYHKYLKDLDDNQRKRRGSPPTFDLTKFKNDLSNLRKNHYGSFPDFDHKIGDPQEGKIIVDENHKFVIVEGLWLFINELDANSLFDVKIFLDCSKEEMYRRLIKRHVETGLEKDEEAAFNRIKHNDEINADYVKANSNIDESFLILQC